MAIVLFLAVPADIMAKEAFAERVFAEEAFAKEVLAEEEDVIKEGSGEECEISQDVFYKDWEGNPLKGCVSGHPAPEWGETDYRIAQKDAAGLRYATRVALRGSHLQRWLGAISVAGLPRGVREPRTARRAEKQTA